MKKSLSFSNINFNKKKSTHGKTTFQITEKPPKRSMTISNLIKDWEP